MRGTTNMNTTVDGSSCPSLLNPTADKILQIFGYYLILAASLVGNSVVGIIVYKTPTLRKSIKYFIANMAMSDLLYPIKNNRVVHGLLAYRWSPWPDLL